MTEVKYFQISDDAKENNRLRNDVILFLVAAKRIESAALKSGAITIVTQRSKMQIWRDILERLQPSWEVMEKTVGSNIATGNKVKVEAADETDVLLIDAALLAIPSFTHTQPSPYSLWSHGRWLLVDEVTCSTHIHMR